MEQFELFVVKMEVVQLSSDVASLLADARSGKGLTLSQLQALQQIHQLKAWQQRQAEGRGEKATDLQRQAEPVPSQSHLLRTNTVATRWSQLEDCPREYIRPPPLDGTPPLSQPLEKTQDPCSRAHNAAESHHNTVPEAQNTVDFSGAVVLPAELSSVYSDSCESLLSADSVCEPYHAPAADGGEMSLGVVGAGNPLPRGDDRPIHPGVGVGSECGTFEEMLEKQLQMHQAEVGAHSRYGCPLDACSNYHTIFTQLTTFLSHGPL